MSQIISSFHSSIMCYMVCINESATQFQMLEQKIFFLIFSFCSNFPTRKTLRRRATYTIKLVVSPLDTYCDIEKNSLKSIYNTNPPTQPL